MIVDTAGKLQTKTVLNFVREEPRGVPVRSRSRAHLTSLSDCGLPVRIGDATRTAPSMPRGRRSADDHAWAVA